MKYYAVTDDPNELAHWGIKGMKWGVRRTDAQLGHPRHTGSKRPRSAAYKRASAKLSASMRNGIQKVETKWKVYNSPENKALRAYKKSEKNFEKHMEKARKGTLKYKGISDAEVERITDRLALERNSRALSGTENPSYFRRLRTAAGAGIIEGVGRGTAAYMEERWRGRGRTTADIKRDKRMAKYESSVSGRRAAKRKAKKDINEEYYRTSYEEGNLPVSVRGARNRAKYLAEVKKRNKESDYRSSIQKAYDEQNARARATNDARLIDDDKRGYRNDSNRIKLEATQVKYLDPATGKTRTGSAIQALNAWNTAHENVNKHGNAYYDSMNTSLAKIKADQARNLEQAKRDKAFNESLRNKQRQDAARESARMQREQERQARLDEQNERRRQIDVQNTSNRRKRKGRS